MKKAFLLGVQFFVLSVFAEAVPHWISVMPLQDGWRDEDVVADAVELGERTVIDGVAFSCPVHPEGDPVANKASHYARRFGAVAPRIRKGSSVRTGILMQATMGHGGEPGSRTPWQLAVHADGKVTYRFCPLDPRFLDYIARTSRTLSAAKPDFFMVDDDTRLIWKKPGCFCPLHLAAFAERTGRAWTREEVVARLDAGDREVTEKWLSLKAESLAAFFRTIRENYDPSIPGILCACAAAEHMRHAREFARILAAPGQVPMVRGNGAPYGDTSLEAITWIRSSYAAQRAFVGDGVDYLQESDTCPHTRWGASATALVNEMVMLALEGVKGAKIWITRSEPSEGRSRMAYRKAFRENRGLMEWTAKTDFRQRGFVIPPAVTNAYSAGIGSWGARYFSRVGIPYRIGAPAKGEVVALSGETVDNLTDAELRELLSGLVLLDGTAAIRLTERGFAADIGVEAKPWTGRTVQRQEFADGRRSGRSLVAGSADLSRIVAGAAVRSRLFNRPKLGADFEPIAPGSVLFANARGGRVYSFAQALVELRPIYHASAMYSETYRDAVMKAGAELCGTIPGGAYYLGDEPMMFEIGEADADGTVFVLDNLELDADDAPEIAFAEPPVAIERLRASDGSWQPVRFTCGSNGVCRLETVVRTEEPAVFRVSRSGGTPVSRVDEDLLKPVRPGGVGGQAFWNERSVMFLYPPAFDFPDVGDSFGYRYSVEDDGHRVYEFEAADPRQSLAPIWAQLPTGFLRLEVYGLRKNKKVQGLSGSRRFWKSAPFSPSVCPTPAWDYRTAAAKYYDWLFAMKNTKQLIETGEPDEYYLYNTYPAKTESALVEAFLHFAELRPEKRETALRAARHAADFLLGYSNPKGSPLESFPHTYRVLKPEESRKGVTSERYAGQNMLIYPATVGRAYLALHKVTGEAKYLKAAEAIAETYRRLQGEDGTWYLKLWEKDGSPVNPNRLFPLGVCDFLESLHGVTGKAVYREMADRAFAYVERGPLTTWNWEAQFEDTPPSKPFQNMSIHPPCDAALFLLRRYPGDAAKRTLARECVRFAEDQFVSWRPPFTADGRGPICGNTTMIPQASQKAWYDVPGAFEQYAWYLPIDGSAAKIIRAYLALYRAEGRASDLAKARALGNAVTRIQKIAGNGAIPTHWVPWDVESDAKHWINCGIGTAAALEELAAVE